MKYILSTFILASIVLSSYGQQDQSTTPQADSIPKEIRANALIYNLAKKYNDPAVTRMALYNLYALNPSIAILDSLALMYYENQQYASAALTAQDAASYNPNDLLANEIAAVSFDNLGNTTFEEGKGQIGLENLEEVQDRMTEILARIKIDLATAYEVLITFSDADGD